MRKKLAKPVKKIYLYIYVRLTLGEKMQKILYVVILFLCVFINNVKAQTVDDISRIENYLNNVKTISAKFVQDSSNGATAEGNIVIAKPNKIRMEYASPTDVLIVGNGQYIVYYDKELDQVTNIDYNDIPASMLLANDIKIDGKKIKVIDFYKDAGTTSVTVEYVKENTGPITLVFSNNPFELKQWKIIDHQSIEVVVSLYDAEKDENVDNGLFKFQRNENKSNNGIKQNKRKR